MNIKIVKHGLLICCMMLASVIKMQAQDSSGLIYSRQFLQQYAFYTGQVISQPLSDVKNYSLVEGGYRKSGGAYRLSQDGSSQQDIFFRTKEIKQVKKFLVSGQFAYQRGRQDSTAFTLRQNLYGAAPYYFFAEKKGHWDLGTYNLQGMLSRRYNKWTIGAGASYNALNAWRTSDPRPEYFDHAMQAGVTVHYALSPVHSIGAAGNYYKRHTEDGIDYRNDNYSQGVGQYPEYATYIQYGYGRIAPQTIRRNIHSNTNGWELQGIYHGLLPVGEVTVKGGYQQLDSRYFLPGTSTGEVPLTYGFFYEDIYTASLYWKYRRGKHLVSLAGNYINHYGADFNNELHGNNYIYTFEQAVIQPLYTHFRDKKLLYEAGIDASLSDLYRADGSSSILTDYQYAQITVKGGYYLPMAPGNLLKASVSAGMQLPVSSEVKTSSQGSAFLSGVVLPDAAYYQARSFTAGIGLLYSITFKKTSSFIRIKGQYRQATVKEASGPGISYPGDNRWYWQAAIGVNLQP